MGIINNQNELTMSAAALLRQAEELKASVAETSKGSSEAWVKRQQLQDLYQRLLVSDLEYALDKKLEQDLWNYVFKNQITTFQGQVRDKTNPKRGEIQASLNLFLETASGFYLQLLQELCNAFDLDLPFRKNPASIGILQEYGPTVNKVKQPGKTSSHYVCQHCLVHLGDIARYRQQIDQAQTYYRHAANLVPYNGQPYNQLAILEAAKGSKLSTVFFYLRSVAVKHPFPVAATNLEKLYAKLARDSQHGAGSGVKGSKLTMNELVTVFLQFHALVHQSSDLSRAKTLSGKLVVNLTAHLTSLSFTSRQLVHMVAINLFALHHAKSLPAHKDNSKDSGGGDDKGDSSSEMSRDEQEGYDLVFNLMLHFFDLMLQCTPRQETKAREYHTLPAIKVILDWFHTDRDILAHPAFKSFTIIWPNLARALNTLQFSTNIKVAEIEKYRTIPLPEDQDLQCFLPIEKAHRYLEMERAPAEGLPDEIEQQLRCHRLLQHGLWICDEFPSLNRLNVQKLRTGRLQFTAPTPHVKVLQSNSSSTGGGAEETGQVRTATVRQNVAIQAIMQNKNKATAATSTDSATATTPVPHAKEDGGSNGGGKSSSLSRSNSLSSAETRPTQTAAAATTKAQASSTKAHTHDAGMMTQAIPLQPGGRRLQRHFEGVRTSDPPPPVLPTPHHRHHHPGAERFPMGIPPSLDPPQPRITTQPPIQMTVRPPMDSQINQIRQPFSHPQQPPPPPESAFDALQKLQQQNEALLKLQKLYQQNEHAAANNFPGHGFQNFPGEPSPRNETPGDLLAAHLTPKLRAAIGLPPHPQHQQQHQPQPQHQPQHQPQQQMDPIQRLLHNAAQQQQQQQQHHQQQQQQHLNLNQPFTTASFTPSPIAQPLSSQPQQPPSPGSLTVEQLFTLVTQQQQHDKAPLPPYPPNLQLNLPPEPATSPATFLFGNKGSQQSPAVSSLFGQQSRSPGLMSPGGEPFAGGENHPTNPSIGAPHKRHSDGGRKNTPSPLSLSSNLEAPKHDSPPSGANLLASLFGRSDTLRPEIVQNELENGGNQYSLFGDSGWNYDSFMPKKDAAGSSIGSSPGSSSIRSTPDPTTDEGRYEGRQNFWSSGPSPLERLLEQQKQQRQQSEPH